MTRKKNDDPEGSPTPVVAVPPTPPAPAPVAAATEPDEPIDPQVDAYLRANRIVQVINESLPEGLHGLPPIPADYVFKRFDREVTTLALHAAFELRGGVPALARWADTDPKSFYNIWSKLLPTEQAIAQANTNIVFQSAVPSNPLDSVSIDQYGRVVTADVRDDLPE